MDIFKVSCANGIAVNFMLASYLIKNDCLTLQQFATDLSKLMTTGEVYGRVQVPMVDLDIKFPHTALINSIVRTEVGASYLITQADIHAIMKLDEHGAKAEADETISLTPFDVVDNMKNRIFVIRGNFLVWFEYRKICYFAAYIAEDCMRRPRAE